MYTREMERFSAKGVPPPHREPSVPPHLLLPFLPARIGVYGSIQIVSTTQGSKPDGVWVSFSLATGALLRDSGACCGPATVSAVHHWSYPWWMWQTHSEYVPNPWRYVRIWTELSVRHKRLLSRSWPPPPVFLLPFQSAATARGYAGRITGRRESEQQGRWRRNKVRRPGGSW